MPEEEIHYPDGRIERANVRRETRDVSMPWIIGLLSGAICLALLTFYLVWLFFGSYTRYENTILRSPYPLAPVPSAKLPPEPRLDPLNLKEHLESANVYAREKRNLEILNGVGTTSEKGYLHIPIERAMDLLAGKLPVAPQPPERLSRRANGLLFSGGPNSGRVLRQTPLWYER
jgi:hypothetical protein